MERIGEVVSGILGLEESRFQYVIDGMTEEDWKRAMEVNAERENELAQDIECAGAHSSEAGGNKPKE